MANESKKENASVEESKNINLIVNKPAVENDSIDLVGVAGKIKSRAKRYGFLIVAAVIIGAVIGAIVYIIKTNTTNNYSNAVLTFSYEGAEQGLDPNGGSFDITKLTSATVLNDAALAAGLSAEDADDIRQNLKIEGVVPQDVANQITALQKMALEKVEYYQEIANTTYYPTKYIVKLTKDKSWSAEQTNLILDKVLDAYVAWFTKTYANTDVLSTISIIKDVDEYEYTEIVDMLNDQIDIMITYLETMVAKAPDFRSVETQYSFDDIISALTNLKSVRVDKVSSNLDTYAIAKNKQTVIDFYNYKIVDAQRDLASKNKNLENLKEQIASYQKDPVIIVSGQENQEKIETNSEYYDNMVANQIKLSNEISDIEQRIETYQNRIEIYKSSNKKQEKQEAALAEEITAIVEDINQYALITETTVKEYYDAELLSNAVKVASPAEYQSRIQFSGLVKNAGTFAIIGLVLVIVVWAVDGFRLEMLSNRKKEEK